MSPSNRNASWETRLGLGLLGGLLVLLFYVAWRKIDSLLVETSPGIAAAQPNRQGDWKAGKSATGPTVLPPAAGSEKARSPAPLATGGQAFAKAHAAPTYGGQPAPAPRPAAVSATIVGFHQGEEPRAADEPIPAETYSPDQEAAEEPAESDVETAPPDEQFTIVTGERDSFWTIAERVYGDGAWYKALYAHNRHQFPFPDRLGAGESVAAPPADELRRLYPILCPEAKRAAPGPTQTPVRLGARGTTPPSAPWAGRTYVVQSGQTLAEIAELTLGRRSRWTELYRLNKDRLGEQFDNPPEGLVLVLPEEAHIADAYDAEAGERR
jgi:nucleoid-associated protein YgaU